MTGSLYIVSTPIGNLGDISLRALEILKSVDVIACEDTRHSRKLLNHFDINTKLISYHEHNENSRSDELVKLLIDGRSIAIISDAGTPAINDPGSVIVRKAIESGIAIVPVPGAAAFLAALTVSGLSTESFYFGGFLPSRTGERRRRLTAVRSVPATLIFYETPHRIAKSLLDCAEILGDRPAAVFRELTKIHEESFRGSLFSLNKTFANASFRGEFVLIIDKAGDETAVRDGSSLKERMAEIVANGVEKKVAMKQLARELKISKSEVYRRLQ